MAVPETDLDLQWRKLSTKFRSLAVPVVGDDNAGRIIESILALESTNALAGVISYARGARYEPLIR